MEARLSIQITVNGKSVSDHVEPRTLLAHYLRDGLGLTGTHIGCDTSQCGACTVLLDGEPVKSCTVLAVQADGTQVMTVEGLAAPGTAHPVQQAFQEMHGLQCGFCTPGVVMLSTWLVQQHQTSDLRHIRESLDGIICRCTGYENIVKAIARAGELAVDEPAAPAASQREGVPS